MDLSNQAILEVTKGIYKDALAMKSEQVKNFKMKKNNSGTNLKIVLGWRKRNLYVPVVRREQCPMLASFSPYDWFCQSHSQYAHGVRLVRVYLYVEGLLP